MLSLKGFANAAPELRHNAMRRIFQLMLVNIFTGIFLLGGAGTVRWGFALLYIALCFLITFFAPFVTPIEILAERGSKKENTEKWDKTLVKLLGLTGFSIYLVAGLDFRWHWTSSLRMEVHICGILIFLLGFVFMVWAMFTNRFFSTAVRIQFDRGQIVCMSGPYRFIRHPGYLGMIVYYMATPIFLGSLWALIPSFATMAVFIIRTGLEDKTLLEKLPGYREYAARTRYRLIPGVW